MIYAIGKKDSRISGQKPFTAPYTAFQKKQRQNTHFKYGRLNKPYFPLSPHGNLMKNIIIYK
jgi:hypothetical protein